MNRWKVAATVVLALALIRVYPADDGRVETVRSFFGVHNIVVTPNGQYHVLMHGTTIHGAERVQNNDGTPISRMARADFLLSQGRRHRAGHRGDPRTQGGPIRVAVIGLGAGTLTCASQPGEKLDILRDRSVDGRHREKPEILHRYVRNPLTDLKPVMGDARLTSRANPMASTT